MKKILILGGGINQIPLLKAAKDEGYCVVLCDYNPNAQGRKFSDIFYEVSIIDREAVLEVAKKENIDGIVANTESVMELVAYVTEQLGLVGNKESSIHKFVSKSCFRNLQYSINVYAPKHCEVASFEATEKFISSFRYPIIIKPSQCSGSRGVTVIKSSSSVEEIKKSIDNCKSYSRNGKVILEEYVDMSSMDEIEAEIFVHNGCVLWDGLLLTLRDKNRPLIPMTDIYPLPYNNEKKDKIKKDLELIIKSAGITHGEYNAELYFTPNNDLFVMEINARQGGDSIPFYVQKYCGVNMYKLLVTTAVGDDYYWNSLFGFKRNIKYVTHHPLFSYIGGKYRGLQISDEIRPFLSKIYMPLSLNDYVVAAKDASDEIGFIDLIFPNQNIQIEISSNINNYIKVLVD